MKTTDFLRQHDACRDCVKWALSIGDDMADVWDAMIKQGKHTWLLWTATRPGVFSDRVLRKLACRFVRETPLGDGRKVWDLLTDESSRNAVAVAERYEDGKATKEELADARNAACNAANEAANAAADATANVADYDAAHASAYAAYVVYDTADRAAANEAAKDAYTSAKAAVYVAAYDAADVVTYAADYVATCAAQIRMVAELGNPFKEGNGTTDENA